MKRMKTSTKGRPMANGSLLRPLTPGVAAVAILGLFLGAAGPSKALDFLRGDANGDGAVTLADAHKVLAFLFRDGEA
ncbi:MAG: hypothetical protein ACRD2T_16385, partial [Thermoanaerobaculia bacterium]